MEQQEIAANSRKSIFQVLLELEKKHALWEKQTSGGVRYWKLIRFNLFHAILRQISLTQERTREGSEKKARKTSLFWESLNSVLLCFKKVDAIVLEFPRKVRWKGSYLDPYTQPLIEDLQRNGLSYIMVEGGGHGHQNRSLRRRRYVGDSIFERLMRRNIERKADLLDPQTQESIKSVLGDLSTILGKAFKYNETRGRLIEFELQRKVWRRVFPRTRCKDLYLVCSYGYEGIIAAAQENGVRVTELQHGTISKYHPGYSFGIPEVPYFPDRLFAFGRKWCGSFLPLRPTNCIVYGYRYLNQCKKQIGISQDKHGVVFLSQWSINEKLLDYAISLHKTQPNLRITYKFHPRESDAVVARARNSIDGMKFIKNEKHLYELLSEAHYAVGVFSTAISEALAFGCRIVLVAAPGIELIEDMIKDLHLPVVSSTLEFTKFFSSDETSFLLPADIDAWFHGCRG